MFVFQTCDCRCFLEPEAQPSNLVLTRQKLKQQNGIEIASSHLAASTSKAHLQLKGQAHLQLKGQVQPQKSYSIKMKNNVANNNNNKSLWPTRQAEQKDDEERKWKSRGRSQFNDGFSKYPNTKDSLATQDMDYRGNQYNKLPVVPSLRNINSNTFSSQSNSLISSNSQIHMFYREVQQLTISQMQLKYQALLQRAQHQYQIAHLHSIMLQAAIFNRQSQSKIQYFYSKAISIYKLNQPIYFQQIIAIRHNLAQYYADTIGLIQKGLSQFVEVRKMQEKYLSKGQVRNFLTMNNIGCTLCSLKRYKEGLQYFQECLSACRSVKISKQIFNLIDKNKQHYQKMMRQQ